MTAIRLIRATLAGVGAFWTELIPGDQPMYSAASATAAERPAGEGARTKSAAPPAGHPTSADHPAAETVPASSPLAGTTDPAAGSNPVPAAGSPLDEQDTSNLLAIAADQLEAWCGGSFASPSRREYLGDLINELRQRATRFAIIEASAEPSGGINRQLQLVESGHDIGLSMAAEFYPQHTKK